MRTREEILKEQEREFGSNERYKYVVEALLDIRDLLARDNIDPEKSLLRKP